MTRRRPTRAPRRKPPSRLTKAWQAASRASKVAVAVISGLVIVGSAFASVVAATRSALDPFQKESRLLNGLDVDQDVSFVNGKLGPPILVHLHPPYTVRVYILNDARVETVTASTKESRDHLASSTVLAYGITVTRSQFQYRVRLRSSAHSSSSEVVLGRTPLSAVPGQPSGACAFTGLASSQFQYEERHFYGRAEKDNEFYFGIDDQGASATAQAGGLVNAVEPLLRSSASNRAIEDDWTDVAHAGHAARLLSAAAGRSLRALPPNSYWKSTGDIPLPVLAAVVGWC